MVQLKEGTTIIGKGIPEKPDASMKVTHRRLMKFTHDQIKNGRINLTRDDSDG